MEKMAIPILEIHSMVKELQAAKRLLTFCLKEVKKKVTKKEYRVYREKTISMNHEIDKTIIKLTKYRLVKATQEEWQHVNDFYQEVIAEREGLMNKLQQVRC